MAYTDQAFRFSVAGIPDPAQGLDDEQARYSIAGVTFPSSLTPMVWTQTDRLAVQLLPNPAVWDDYSVRAPIGGVPGAGLADSTDRDGALGVTLGGFTTAFDGTFGTGGFNEPRRLSVQLIPDPATPFGALTRGAIGGIPVLEEFTATQGSVLDTTIDGFSVSFTGEYTQSDFFDISYSVTPTWVATEQPARFGDVDVTLGSFTTALEGQALPPDSTQGVVSSTLSAFTSDFDGTFVVAAGRTGSFSLDIQNFGMTAQGSAVAPGGNTGLVDIEVSGFTTSFDGSFTAFSTDGASSYTLDDFFVGFAGNFFSADTNVGEISATIGAYSFVMVGETVLPNLGRYRSMEDAADLRTMTDNADIRAMQ